MKKIVLFLIIAFVGIQFIPTTRNESTEILETDFTQSFEVPQDIQSLLKTSCYDCHSNNTSYPWYNKIQPVSWFLENHINEGKSELNFSEFGSYSKRKQKSKLKAIINQIKDDEMPLSSYELIHQNAKLSKIQKEELLNCMTKLRDSL